MLLGDEAVPEIYFHWDLRSCLFVGLKVHFHNLHH